MMANIKTSREWRSTAAGVLPNQVDKANAELKKAGKEFGFTPRDAHYDKRTGDLVMPECTDQKRNAVLNYLGMGDKDACYGQRAPDRSRKVDESVKQRTLEKIQHDMRRSRK